jgi:hypothetical protein
MVMKTFKTVREAAIAALHEAVPLSAKSGFEYGGFILRIKGGYTYTKAYTDKQTGNVTIAEEDFSIPRGAVTISDYHTHPCRKMLGKELGFFDKFFSPEDIRSSLYFKDFDTAYVAPTCSGLVYESTKNLSVIWPMGKTQTPAVLGSVIGSAL